MKSILYFDGACPLCLREIQLLERLKSADLSLIDIHHHTEEQLPKSKYELLSTLHLKNDSGTWSLGIDASIDAWQYTRYGFLLRPLRWPLIHSIVTRIYKYWAERRYCNLYGQN